MYDKVDLRVPAGTNFGPAMVETAALLRYGPAGSFRPSRFYACVGDLRKSHDLDVVLHLGYKYGDGAHKLEIIDAGKKTLAEMDAIIRQVFDVDPATLELMRVDLAADVPGVPVSWFRDHARFEFKRFASSINKAEAQELEFIGMGTAVAQSLYAGRRPNCIRIYDKFAEFRRQWLKVARAYEQYNRGLSEFDFTEEVRKNAIRIPPTFEEFCLKEGSEYKLGAILTRVERQIGGDRFPKEICTFGDLSSAHEFNPFNALQIVSVEPVYGFQNLPEGASIRDWLAVRGLQSIQKDFGGLQQADAFVLKNGNGNGRRVLESLRAIMPKACPAVSKSSLYDLYRESTANQITENPVIQIHSDPTYENENEIA
jgi:hypothetical protein